MHHANDRLIPARQQEVLQALYRLTQDKGYPPTIREICRNVGLQSGSTGWYHIGLLAAARLVTWKAGENRTLRVTPAGLQALGVPVCEACGGTGEAAAIEQEEEVTHE